MTLGQTNDPLLENSQEISDASPLLWKRDRPTREGYYWYRESGRGLHDVVRVYSRSGSEVLRATGAFFEQHVVGMMDGEWAGPLPYPED